MKNKNFKIIKRFGPSVLKVRIPMSIVNKLNKYIDTKDITELPHENKNPIL